MKVPVRLMKVRRAVAIGKRAAGDTVARASQPRRKKT